MKSTVENLSSVERKILVEVEPERVAQQLDSAYRQLGRSVKIEGFRPGKVPRHILERRFKSQVEAEVSQQLVESTYLEVVKEKNLEVVASPKVEDEPLKVGSPFRYQARVEVRPVIEPKDYAGLAVKRGKHAVTDEDVNKELEKIRFNQSQVVPITDRDVAQKGDYAVIDFEATIEGKAFTGSKGESTNVEVSDGEFVAGHVPQVEGMKVGAEKTVDYKFPDDFRIEEAKGKTSQLKLKLKELKKRELPALDDELAKDVGGGNTLAELTTKVREALESRAKNQKTQETRTAIIQGLVAKNSFECPKAMIERGIDVMVEGGIERMAQQGVDVRQLGLDLNRLREDLRVKAEEEVRGTLLLEAIAKKEKIDPSEEEFNKRLEEISKDNEIPLDKVKQAFRRPDQKEGLMLRLREEKTLAFLEGKANIEES